ncbi:CATRA system-associated protein [Streptomyces sp. NPDC001212]|uniref:CATRA system-associated protein n=1 Tax=unclassified Streptomyces TaxID=2593676 RepID=UPI001CD50BE5|nr:MULTISPECIES: CATRA system-associated protein [unclassified Streptomyces]
MRAELSGLREVSEEILEAAVRSRLTPEGWEQAEASLDAMSGSLDRGDHDGFRQALFRLEDIVAVMRAPRKLTGDATGPSERILERKALIQDRLGREDRERERTEEQNEQ